jgi:formate hydrogenlyase transcriptional activator
MRTADPWESIRGLFSYWSRTWPARYGLAVLAVALATALTLGLGHLGFSNVPYLWFAPAVVLVAMLAGFRPGLLASVLGTAAGGYLLFIATDFSKAHTPADFLKPPMFLFVGIFLTTLTCGGNRARQALRVSESELNRAQAVAHIGSWHYDIERNTLRFSNEAYNIFGLPAKAVISPQQAQNLIHPEDRERVDQTWKAALASGTYDAENRVQIEGRTRWVRVLGSLECNAEGQASKAVGTVQDITERKQAEERLQEYEKTIEGLEEMILVVDRDYRYVIANPAFLSGRGMEKEQLIGRSIAEMMGVDVFDATIKPRLDECFRGKVVNFEKRFNYPSLGERDFSVSYFPLAGANGIERVAVVMQDVTERRRAQEALQESVDRYRDLVEHSEDLVCTHDLEGMLLTVNPAPARILGYTVEELLKIPMRELIVPEGRELFDAYLERLKTTGAPEKGLLCVSTRSGEVRTWQYYNTLRTTGVEKPVVRGMAHDITEQRRAELALQQSEERFRFALKDSPVTVFNQDRDLRYTWVYNPPPEWPTDVIGKTCDDIMGAKNAARLNELNRRVLETGKFLRAELTIGHNGSRKAFEMTLEPLRDTMGMIVGITGSMMDVARLRELADRLEEQRDKLVREKSYLQGEIASELGFEEIVGQSAALREVLQKARVVAPTDSNVLLLGETGTGKELMARAVHALSSRREKSFIKLNCAAVPSGLLESELFGHEKGAFTSAVNQKIGRLELADGGTLFLDEVGELPLELQPKLLRVLQDREFERLGGVRTVHVDVRIISATNRDLQKDVAEKEFREDLFYRLNVFPIQLPALRERKSDIPMLVSHFVHKHAARMGRYIEIIPSDTMKVLENWSWPGNVRELENMIERMVIMSKGNVLAAPPVELRMPQDFPEDDLTEMEREHIIRVLRETSGVLSGTDGAASRLGIKRTTLQSMLKRFGIEPQEFRE